MKYSPGRDLLFVFLAAVIMITSGYIAIKKEGSEPEASELINLPAMVPGEKPTAKVEVFAKDIPSSLSSRRDVVELMVSFTEDYYRGIAELTEKDLTGYFLDPAGIEAQRSRCVLEMVVGMRKMQRVDLKMRFCECYLYIKSVSIRGNICVITAEETMNCRFNCCKDILSETQKIDVTFKADISEGQAKLTAYERVDEVFITVDILRKSGKYERQTAAATMEALREGFLSTAGSYINYLNGQLALFIAEGVDNPVADNPYNREAALSYAAEYALSRNPQYADYSLGGGNCANFGSQSVHAGGIPMDTAGNSRWKYFSRPLDNSASAYGRTSSWTLVSAFHRYSAQNTGYGMVAAADTNIYSLEAGDIIICKRINGEYTHIIVCAGPVYDKAGNVADLLTFSNTIDRRYYPLSAYGYCNYIAIKILGWNN